MLVLNVGGGPTRQLPPQYHGWTQLLLDIDSSVKPDICMDARKLGEYKGPKVDGIYCSHNLEHYHEHEVREVLAGFMHVLKENGTVEIHVPNIRELMKRMLADNLDITDVWYRAGDVPIRFHDVLYGWSAQVSIGNAYYAHKCGFTRLSLFDALTDAGFTSVSVNEAGGDLHAVGRK